MFVYVYTVFKLFLNNKKATPLWLLYIAECMLCIYRVHSTCCCKSTWAAVVVGYTQQFSGTFKNAVSVCLVVYKAFSFAVLFVAVALWLVSFVCSLIIT